LAAPRIQRRVRADAAQIPRLRAAVASFAAERCGYSDEARQAIALAVTEACTNVVRHAYPETPGELALEGWIDDDAQLTVVIIDNGVGVNGASTDAGLGLGLYLMRELADAQISSDHHGTEVRLTFPRR
jgi:serine/threonine-protein kinase RsbW